VSSEETHLVIFGNILLDRFEESEVVGIEQAKDANTNCPKAGIAHHRYNLSLELATKDSTNAG